MSEELEDLLKKMGDKSPLVGADLVPENPDNPDENEPISTGLVPVELEEEKEDTLADQYAENFRKSIELFGDVSGDVLRGIKQDREQTQEVIDHLFDHIKTGGKVSPVYVESLVNALRNKSDINQTAVRVMDSMIKFISAGKGNDALANVNMNIDVAEITAMLAQQRYEDEE